MCMYAFMYACTHTQQTLIERLRGKPRDALLEEHLSVCMPISRRSSYNISKAGKKLALSCENKISVNRVVPITILTTCMLMKAKTDVNLFIIA